MSKIRFLEALIDALDKGELKRFALYSKSYASNKSYMELFKSIKNGKSTIVRKYDNKYAQQRRYLYRSILESLIYKTADNNPEAEVLFLIRSASFLLYKQLPNQAYAVINKALQLVRKYEMFGYHIQIIEIEKQVRMYIQTDAYRKDEEILDDEMKLIAYQSELQRIRLIYNHIITYKKKYGYLNNRLSRQLNNELQNMNMPESEAGCVKNKTKYYYYYSNTIFYRMTNKNRLAYEHSNKMVKMETKPLTKHEQLSGVLEHTTSCICLGKTNELLGILHSVKKNYDDGAYGFFDNLALKLFYYQSNYELMSYVFEGKKEKVIAKIKEINDGMAFWGNKIPVEMQMILASALRLGYFAIGDLKKARKEALFMENKQKSGIRKDVYEDGMVSSLIYIFLKNDVEFLETYASKLLKYFNLKDNMDDPDVQFKYNTAKLFYEFALYKIDKNVLLTQFKQYLEQKMSLFDNGFSEIDYPYYIWANAQIEEKDYLEIARELAPEMLNK